MSARESIVKGPVAYIVDSGELRGIECKVECPEGEIDPVATAASVLESPFSRLWCLEPELASYDPLRGVLSLEYAPGTRLLSRGSRLDGISIELLVSRAIRLLSESVSYSPSREVCDPFIGCAAVGRGDDILFAAPGIAQILAPSSTAPNIIAALLGFLYPFGDDSSFVSATLADLALLATSSKTPAIDRDELLLRHMAASRLPDKDGYLIRKAGYLLGRGMEDEALGALREARRSRRYSPARAKPFTGACDELGAYVFVASMLQCGRVDDAASFAIFFFERDYFAEKTTKQVVSCLVDALHRIDWSLAVDCLFAAASSRVRLARRDDRRDDGLTAGNEG